MKCSYCQSEIKENARFCHQCGKNVLNTLGWEMPETGDAKFCSECGNPIISTGPENEGSFQGHDWLTKIVIQSIERETRKSPKEVNITLNVMRGFVPKDSIVLKTGDKVSVDKQKVPVINYNYDPRVDLPEYKLPPASILKEYNTPNQFIDSDVIEYKEKIAGILEEHHIKVRQISATVGPAVTLFEIVPERRVSLACYKQLENDIASAISYPWIRIINLVTGKGKLVIEVPNKNPELVSMKSLISSKVFQETEFNIPLALGKTITNEPHIVDLTKMPHLLVAGEIGQGKSVLINAIISSILYKKHPTEVKFVLIDPKRVEFTFYKKIERHFLARLPGEQEAIINNTQKVINTLNSLCIEMNNRLDLLKDAHARNVNDYNVKFFSEKLNPINGHRYLPYIVVIIDEFADLLMSAGREIEDPIGRLAQLARLVGIHLIISTSNPSPSIITGFIKANFPSRIALRVYSEKDSKTILDSSGAERLLRRGDMLVSSGSELVRVQGAFIDTTEIEELTEFIGSQNGYPNAMMLPECLDD